MKRSQFYFLLTMITIAPRMPVWLATVSSGLWLFAAYMERNVEDKNEEGEK